FVGRGFGWARDRLFRPLIGWVIALRYAVVLAVIAATIQASLMIYERDVRWRFFAAPASSTVSANFAMVDGATRADTAAMLVRIEEAIARAARELPTSGPAPVRQTVGEIGGNAGRGLAIQDDKDRDLLGSVSIELVDQGARDWGSSDFIAALEANLEEPATLEAFSFRAGRRGPGGDALSIRLTGATQATMAAAASDLRAQLTGLEGITGLEDSLVAATLDRRLTLTDYGATLGFSLEEIAAAIRERTSGLTALEYIEGTEQGVIVARWPAARADLFETLRLTAEDGTPALLTELVEIAALPAPRALRRTNGALITTVRGDLAADAPDLTALLTDEILPQIEATHGVTATLSGLADDEREFLSDAALGYGACLLGIYAVLALVLGSWGRPLAIMLVIPAGLIGVTWGHYLWGLPINIFSIVGFIGLSGIIVNDSIVLSTAITERARSRALIPATIDAACERLRPVLLTTLTTVLGLTPLLFEGSRQAAFLQPMVLTMVSGLTVGFFLVLLLVPALTIIGHDIARGVTSTRRARPALRRLTLAKRS
ncbi:MAG: efflux RND transporter permease subunit, partial [Pseudomonadota bacterium]